MDRPPGGALRHPYPTIQRNTLAQDDDLTKVWGRVVAMLSTDPEVGPREIAFVRLAQPLSVSVNVIHQTGVSADYGSNALDVGLTWSFRYR